MLMVHKQIIHKNITEPRLYGTLAPVVFFSIPLAKGFRIQKSHMADGIQIHAHAKTYSRRHGRILWFHTPKRIINLPQFHSFK